VKPVARLRRTYFDCRYGQLHVHQAIPPGGGFDEAVAVLCIPGAPGRGRFFQALLAPLGADRSIYAPDLPGCGESDGAPGATGAEPHALACIDMLDSLRQRQIDVIAHDAGADVALALVALRPGTFVRRLVLSAASHIAVAKARSLGLEFRELPLAMAADEGVAAVTVTAQLNELVDFFGAAKGAA
jgi:pimeloyl-ACP methyl ester carboxylesterase